MMWWPYENGHGSRRNGIPILRLDIYLLTQYTLGLTIFKTRGLEKWQLLFVWLAWALSTNLNTALL